MQAYAKNLNIQVNSWEKLISFLEMVLFAIDICLEKEIFDEEDLLIQVY